MTRITVVGSGIVGLATARAFARRGHDVVVLEKEDDVARHQTGRNSGVIHSGLYYTPGSKKATMCRAGARSMQEYAAEKGVAHQITGKLVVATDESQLPQLAKLAERAVANGVPSRRVTAEEAREHEPHVRTVGAIRVESTGIVDYTGVCRAMADDIRESGGEIRFGTAVLSSREQTGGLAVETTAGVVETDLLVNCAGLHSDRVAAASGVTPDVRIVPFRGEYFELVPDRSDLVRGLIYPVPDPRFPFLGVHLTKMVDGSVHAGPNAVFALAREGYRWRDVDPRELGLSLTWPGLWRLGAKNVVPGAREFVRSVSRKLFANSLAELVPGIGVHDLVPAKAGVRAQAMHRDGRMVDDFYIQRAARQLHILNAPSPAATCALEIADHIVAEMEASA
ncbi:L-2-hydroxyglutarate oxidase [Schumannella soli]|uniref:L-2-hydroxyglutarate oxidase n=1 Tax=Schumannella soli TaxID=2590779 RepID=A0A506Y330_9MICO|nr:L-2-hydroxyglutarate oxidase [Schumannella soli]TPW75990.1 L-2-hydroxyglutarate oxidase [Schumannella soli]